jgi:hypothetical protein
LQKLTLINPSRELCPWPRQFVADRRNPSRENVVPREIWPYDVLLHIFGQHSKET